MRDASGQYTSGVAVYADITERKRAEEELRQAYETLESIFRVSPAAIVVVDSDLKVRAWNEASERLFGWTADEVIGRELPVVPTGEWGLALAHHDKTLRGETISGLEIKTQRKDGTVIAQFSGRATLR